MSDLQREFMTVTFVNPDVEEVETSFTGVWAEGVHESHE
jgi:hypothetical protein